KQVHRLFAADRLSAAEYSVSAAYAIIKILLAFTHEVLTRSPFVVDQHGHHIADLPQEFLFAAAERDLVADLVEVAHGLGTFAVKAPHRQADFLKTAEDLFDLTRDHQCGQVKHHAHPHPRAYVRRASGQVTEPF